MFKKLLSIQRENLGIEYYLIVLRAYLRRFDIEHLFRFAKKTLLLNNYYSLINENAI